MASLISDLRAELVLNINTAISGVSAYDYLYEYHPDELKYNYLNKELYNQKILQSYGVQVTESVLPRSTGSHYERSYNCVVEMYYRINHVNDLIDDASLIYDAILSGSVTCMLFNWSLSEISISKIPMECEDGEGLLGQFNITGIGL